MNRRGRKGRGRSQRSPFHPSVSSVSSVSTVVHLLFVAAGIAFAACGRPEPPVSPQTDRVFTDGLGRSVAVPAAPRKIISLAPSNTEILFAIGAGPRVVGRDDHSNFPAEAGLLPALGTSGGKLDRERIVDLGPDLILAAEINSPEQVTAIAGLGLTVFRLANPRGFDGLQENVRLAGRLVGCEEAASRLAESLGERVRAVARRLEGVAARPLVFYEIDASDPSRPWTAGPGTFLGTLITLAGGENFGAAYGTSFPRASTEEILLKDPAVIVLGDARFGITPDAVRRRSGWDRIAAVRAGRIYSFDDDLATRPGPRLVDGLEILAALLHPERFGRERIGK